MNITDNDIFAHYLNRNNRANLASLSLLINGESNPVIYSREISDVMSRYWSGQADDCRSAILKFKSGPWLYPDII